MTTPRSILLTGATGSLGGHILAALLDGTGATVHCLVRADSAAGARDRIERRLESLGGPALPGGPRLVGVAADLERPRFGLDGERYDALAPPRLSPGRTTGLRGARHQIRAPRPAGRVYALAAVIGLASS